MGTNDRAAAAAVRLGRVFAERGAAHGDFATNAVVAQALKDSLTAGGAPIGDPVLAEAAEAVCGKLARIASGGWRHVDTWLDLAGYALLAAAALDESEDAPLVAEAGLRALLDEQGLEISVALRRRLEVLAGSRTAADG